MKNPHTETGVRNIGPKRRLSLWRVLVALLMISGLAYGTVLGFVDRQSEKAEPVVGHKPWFAAYADVTSVPMYDFEQLGSTSTPAVILSFIVSSASDSCRPTWGTYYTMDEAAVSLDLDRRIARLRQQGGKVAVSFGGMLNSELALGCADDDKLFDAYKSVIDRYDLDTIDMDLEGQGLTDVDAADRRARVIARLQNEYRNSGKSLAVWLTLPVAPQGLTQGGADAVARMLSGGVDLAGVNLMTMDYGASKEQGQTMLDASEKALIETHRQLGILYDQAGINLNDESLWRKIGATPMIGQNDVADEVFTLEDAQGFNRFVREKGVRRMSMWSANRDIPCGENYVDPKVVSDSCSGVKAPKFGFSQALSSGLDGDMAQNADIRTTEDPEVGVYAEDDPERSPYQIWKEKGSYPKGVKVVWHGNVYEAKWWTKSDLPDNPVLQSWETPWKLIGPVLAGERPVQQPTLPKGTYPKWSGKTVYDAGDRVLFEGVPFQAKWWNQGESPAASIADNSDSSPWLPFTQSQIADMLKGSDATMEQ